MPLLTTESTTRQQQALATKERIAKAALRLFAEQGFAATSTKQVAKEAGVSEGLIFHYYPTKLGLLYSLSKSRRTLAGEIGALLAEAGDQPAAQCLRVIADRFLQVMLQEKQFLNVMFGESRTNDELYGLFNQIVETTVAALAAYLETRVAAGELRADLETNGAARAFFSPLILFFLLNKHLSDEAWQTQAKRYADDTLTLWFRGALAAT